MRGIEWNSDSRCWCALIAIGVTLTLAQPLGGARLAAQEQPAATPDFVVLGAFDVNLRAGPGTEHVVIGQADKGDLFICTGERDGWYRIEMFSGVDRYVSSRYAYPLTRAQIVPGHRLRLPDETTGRALRAAVRVALELAERETAAAIPQADAERRRPHRAVLEDRLLLATFHQYGVQPAIYRALLDDMGFGRDTLPSVEQILERYIEAIGGRSAIARLDTRIMRGRIVTDLPTWSPPVYEDVAVEIRAASGHGYLQAQYTAQRTYWDGYDGVIGWGSDGEQVRIRDRVDRGFAWLVDPQGALRMWEHLPHMTLRGRARLEGRWAYVVDIGDDEDALYFDAETGLLVRLGYNRELSVYRSVDGVLVPFRYATSRRGGSSTYVFGHIEHNVPVDVTAFAVPDTTGVG